MLDYLARYVFRVAITNTRIVGLDDEAVTIRHKHRKSNRWRTSRIPGQEFMRRFLQHVLPKGLHKVRYFGLWHPAKREDAARARLLLLFDRQATPRRAQMSADAADPEKSRTVRGSVPAAAKAFSCLSASSPRSGPKDHDPRTPSSRHKHQIVTACLGHATNTFGPARQSPGSRARNEGWRPRAHPLERRNGDENTVQRPRLAPSQSPARPDPD